MKKTSIGLLVLVIFLFLGPTGVQAKASVTPFSGIETTLSAGMPERQWVDDNGVLHVRGVLVETVFEGTLTGTNRVVVNANIELTTGEWEAFGSFALSVTWGELSGTFEGRFSVTSTAGAGLLEYVGHGSGDFEGMKLMGTGNQDPDTVGGGIEDIVFVHQGIVLNPHG